MADGITPTLGGDMREARFKEVKTYITWSHNMVAQYIAMRAIVDLCEEVELQTVTWVSNRWWGKEGLNLVEVQAAVVESVRVSN